MKKYIVFKKVLAHELILVEGETPANAVENVIEGKEIIAKAPLEWEEDCDPYTWLVEPIDATDEELKALRKSKNSASYIFTDYDSSKEID